MLGMLDGLCDLFLEKGFAPYVGLKPKSALFFQTLLTQRTSDLHLK